MIFILCIYLYLYKSINIGDINIMTKSELKKLIRQCYQQVNNKKKRVVKQSFASEYSRRIDNLANILGYED